MHSIEPFYLWQNLYIASEDELSPFYGREYSESEYTNTIYNHYIHPQWDYIGSETLYIKILYADYHRKFAIIEMIGEWNDCINNDIMFLKRDVIETMTAAGISKYILIGENVLNFHASDDCYYDDWFQDIEEGWIIALNFREHVIKEFLKINLDSYMLFGGRFNTVHWRTMNPVQLFELMDGLVLRRLE